MRLKRVLCLALALCLLAAVLPTAGQEAVAAAKYYITVDLTNQIVTVYNNGNTTEAGIVRQMICSTGKSGTPTPTGTYTLPSKTYSTERTEWYYFPVYKCYAKWATRIVGGILFHSVIYSASKRGPTSASVKALGSKASHGCVRLRVEDAKWIAQNCPAGTRCRIYNSGKTNAALRKRLLSKSFSRASETYDHFMGRTAEGGEDASGGKLSLSRGSSGEKVKLLQKRLKELGFLNDTVDGKFGANTEAAVKYFQAAKGLKKTGAVDDALWARLFAADAPTGTYVTLAKGMSGPAVSALQQALAELKLFGGSVNGSFLKDTEAAVKQYQGYFGFAVNGKANQALQKDILKRAEDVKTWFGGGDYQLTTYTEAVQMARVKVSSATLRAKAKASAKALAKLKKKAEVEVLSKGATWSKVRYNNQSGYIQTKSLTFFTGTRTAVSYEPGTEPTPTPEISLPTPTPEIFIPTPTPEPTSEPTPTPEVYIPTPTPEPEEIISESEAQSAGERTLAGPEALEIEQEEGSGQPDAEAVAVEPGAEGAPEATREPPTLDDFEAEPVEENLLTLTIGG